MRGVSARTPWNPIAADCVVVHDELEPIAAVPSLPSASSGVASARLLLWRSFFFAAAVCFLYISYGGDGRWGEFWGSAYSSTSLVEEIEGGESSKGGGSGSNDRNGDSRRLRSSSLSGLYPQFMTDISGFRLLYI